jgi:hypothetical protein
MRIEMVQQSCTGYSREKLYRTVAMDFKLSEFNNGSAGYS